METKTKRSHLLNELMRLSWGKRVETKRELEENKTLLQELNKNRTANRNQIDKLKEEVKFFGSEIKDNV